MAKVLVVDDEEVLANAYQIVLKKAGHEVYVAYEAKTALDLARQHKPDVILLDMLMPQMNGIEFMKMLDAKNTMPKVKIIAFSNIENADVVSAAKKLGVVSYLSKVDFTPHQIAEVVAKVIG